MHTYWYVPATVKVSVKVLEVSFSFMLPESKRLAPEGQPVAVTVCGTGSRLVQVTLPPFATVTLAGSKLSPCVLPTPFGIETLTVLPPVFELENAKIGEPVVSW